MADKLSWTELRHAIAQRTGVSEKQVGSFLAALQEQLTEGLKKDKMVKINGLGTFKLQAVAPRKSVNVSTGEEIIIEGYNKVVFVPEAGVKELVEKAGEMGVTAEALHLTEKKEAVDPLKKLGEQAEEIVDILGELGQGPKEKKSSKVQEVQEKPKKSTPKKKIEKLAEPEKPEEPVQEEPEKPFVPEAPVEPEKPEKPEAQEETKAKKPYHFVRDTLICVVILLLLLLVGYFFLRNQLSGWIDELVQPKAQTERVEEFESSRVQEVQEVQEISETPEVQEPVQEPVQEVQEPVQEWRYDKLIKTEEIRPGSRLAWISKRYYGSKVYWPYLYAANKDHIDNPSYIPVGTPIRIPKLTAADRDTTSAQFKQLKEAAEAALR